MKAQRKAGEDLVNKGAGMESFAAIDSLRISVTFKLLREMPG
jgi:hypothetical protein